MNVTRGVSIPLRVGTFNTQLLPYMVSCGSGARSIAARIIEGGYDLIGLSEVFSNQGRRELLRFLSPHYPHGVWYLGSKNHLRLNSGLMLFSKLPLEDLGHDRRFLPGRGKTRLPRAGGEVSCVRFDEYTDRCCSDGLAAKGCGYVRISVDGHALHVFFTHVQASYLNHSVTRYLKTVNVRAAQIRQMATFMRTVLGGDSLSGENVLIMGDFNVHWSASGAGYPHRGSRLHGDEWESMFETFGQIFRGGLVDVWQRYAPAADMGLTYPAVRPNTRPDYILLSAADPEMPLCAQHVSVAHNLARDGRRAGATGPLLSDHFGVQADLNLPAPHGNAADACALAVDGNEICMRGYIRHHGGVQWYRLAAPGKYVIRVVGASREANVSTELYAEQDISRPLASRKGDAGDPVIAKAYTVAGASYLRVGDPQDLVRGQYTLQVRKAQAAQRETGQSVA
jgi:endonuclease/exonuclease/phosphatase family metal-dependent hydrolase